MTRHFFTALSVDACLWTQPIERGQQIRHKAGASLSQRGNCRCADNRQCTYPSIEGIMKILQRTLALVLSWSLLFAAAPGGFSYANPTAQSGGQDTSGPWDQTPKTFHQ